jgi:hypothetical protein
MIDLQEEMQEFGAEVLSLLCERQKRSYREPRQI